MQKKKLLTKALAVVLAIGLAVPTVTVTMPETVRAETTENWFGSLEYCVLDDGTVEITGYDRSSVSVVIPSTIDGKNVTSIRDFAFWYCSGLTSIEISDNVTSIGACAFDGCSGLTSIDIPDSVTNIGDYAFRGCSGLTSIKVSEENTVYTSANSNVIMRKEDSVLIAGCNNSTIPNSVTSIGNYAFSDCSGLTSIDIPNSVISIGNSAFRGCSGMESIKVSEENTVYTSANSNVIIRKKDNVLIAGCKNSTIPSSVTSIEGAAFNGCSGLMSIEIPDNVTSIGYYAFCNCSGLTSIEIPGSVTSIEYGAFYDCSGLTSIEIPGSVTSIGDEVFGYCSKLTSIKVSEENTVYTSANSNVIMRKEDNVLIAGCKNSIIPNGVTSIGDSAFFGCKGLTSIEIPDSVTSIGDWTFDGCSNLTSIEIPNSVTNIGGHTFSCCSGLTSIKIPDNVTSIGDEAFDDCNDLTIYCTPNSTAYNYAIENNISVKNIDEFNKPEEEQGWFDSLKYRTLDDEAVEITGYNGELANVVIPETINGKNVKSIGAYAFYGSGLISIEIPDSVTSIGESAFNGCRGLTSIEISDSVTSIGESAFNGCSGLTSIEIPDSVTSIEASAFDGCSSLTSIEIPNSVTSIGYGAFNGCSGLTSIRIPSNVTGIEKNVFYKCSNLTIYCTPNSTAYNYAIENNIPVKNIEDFDKPEEEQGCDGTNHTYKEPTFEWSADGKSAKIVFVCEKDETHVTKYDAIVTPTVKEAATCHTKGTTTYTAVYDKYTATKDVQDIEINKANHTGGTEIRNAKAATYKEAGYTGDVYCKDCGEKLETGKAIAKLKSKTQKITVDKKFNKSVVLKSSSLKKKKAEYKLKAKAKGTLTYKVTKGKSKYISVSKKGVVTLKKGCKKGTYKVTVTAAATKSGEYKKAAKTVVFVVK